MAVGETAKLIASLELKDKFSPTVAKANAGLIKLDRRIDATSSKAHQAGQHIGIGIQNAAKLTAIGVGILATNVALGLNSLVKLEQAQAQTAAVLKSTGQAAGVTGEQVTALAEKYEAMNATIGDEFIRSAENMILTFTNIKGKAFEPALEAVLNMNTAMGKGPEGLQTTAIQVGKALNDPIKGITALRKVGVSFTKQQVDQIKALVKSGKTLEAQKIVLAELNKEFGGSFLAQGGTTGAKVAKFGDAIEDLQRTLAAGFLPVVAKVADKLSALFADPKVTRAVEEFGQNLAGLFSDENINQGAKILQSLFRTAQEVAPAIASAAKVTGEVVKTAVAMFTSLPKELQTLIVGGLAVNKLTGGIVTNLASGLISSVLKQLVSGVVNVQGGVVNVAGGLGGAGGAGGAAGGVAGKGGGILKTLGALGIAIAITEAIEEGIKLGTAEVNKQTGLGLAPLGPSAGPFGSASFTQTAAFDLGQIIIALSGQKEAFVAAVNANKAAIFTASQQETTDAEKTRQRFTEEMTGFKSAHKDSTTKQTNAIEHVRGRISDVITNNTAQESKTQAAARTAGITAALASKNAGTVGAAASRAAGQAAKSGGDHAAAAIRGKKMSFSTTVNVSTRVSVRDNIASEKTVSKYGHKVL